MENNSYWHGQLEPTIAKRQNGVSAKRLEQIMSRNLLRKKPSKRITDLAFEILALKRAIEFQGKAMEVKERDFLVRLDEANKEVQYLRQQCADLAVANKDTWLRKMVKNRLQDILEEL